MTPRLRQPSVLARLDRQVPWARRRQDGVAALPTRRAGVGERCGVCQTSADACGRARPSKPAPTAHTPAGAVGAAAADGEAGADEKRRSASPKMVFISGACERACAGVLLLPGRFWHCRLVSVPGLGPPSLLHPGRSLAPQARLNPAFRTLLALQARLDLAFWTLLAPPARLDPPLRTPFAPQARWLDSLPQFPDAFGAAGSSRSLS